MYHVYTSLRYSVRLRTWFESFSILFTVTWQLYLYKNKNALENEREKITEKKKFLVSDEK